MAEETQISTPVETPVDDTSTIVEPDAEVTTDNPDTSIVEPETVNATAETETQEAETLYAGKYKTVEDLEKGYNEAQKFVSKASEWENKYNELLAKQNAELEKMQAQQLQEARTRGFNSYEEQKIAEQVQLAEFELFAHNLNSVNPENLEAARQNLLQYYQTAHPAYLEEAKRYFPSNFIEQVALDKSRLQNQLLHELHSTQAQAEEHRMVELAQVLKTDFADFLADLAENEGKAQALHQFCAAGFINSKEDMQAFQDVVSKIESRAKEQAIKEYEAQKAIEATKHKAVIDAGNGTLQVNSGLKEQYTSKDIGAMTQEEYNALCDKYGEDEIFKRII